MLNFGNAETSIRVNSRAVFFFLADKELWAFVGAMEELFGAEQN